jgi:TatA/E family protein of Tat protein translocase
MFSVPHLVIIFIVVLVVFGPHRLPELARGLGKMMAEFRKASTDFKMAFEEEMRTIERQARETEFKKSQEAAAAASSQQQPATPAGAETPKILSETVTPTEPVISPVTEAVSREAHSSDQSDSAVSTEPTATEQPVSDQPVTEGTSPGTSAGTSSESDTTGPSPRPANDQRQSA